MMNFLIPKLYSNLYEHIDCISSSSSDVIMSNSLNFFLNDIKKKINIYEEEWKIYKKYTNPYEFIHTNIPFKNKCIGKYHPLSRSYFKMIELMKFFNLDKFVEPNINCFHLAEGPGGFVEALVFIRGNKDDVYTGMTLLDNTRNLNIPGWKKSNSFLKNNPNVFIESGADGTGNIISLENLDHINAKFGNRMNIITADGGFDFSSDFDNQELNMTQLLFSQVVFAICMQKNGGSFILKVFDTFMSQTIDIIAILSSFYDKVYITKPQTSRYANSEKYIVCMDFNSEYRNMYYPIIRKAFEKMIITKNPQFINRFINIPIPLFFLSRIDEYNAIFGQRQLENIHSTITLIEDSERDLKIINLQKINIQKCFRWCIQNSIPYNNIVSVHYNNSWEPSRNCFR